LVCNENRLGIYANFETEENVLSYFSSSDIRSLLYTFHACRTQKEKKFKANKLRGLDVHEEDIGLLAVNELKGEELTDTEIKVIAELLSSICDDYQTVLGLLTNSSFKYLQEGYNHHRL
jgi:hypothetical protein